MANLAKFAGGFETSKMYEHWAREKDENGEYKTYPREEGGGGHIDHARTPQNYTIGEVHDRAWIKQRLNGVYQKPGQKRNIQTCDIVITLPRSESYANQKEFFQAAYDSLVKMYGQHNNVIGAWVHLDEAQPHMHFAFMPISERSGKTRPEFKERLSVKAYWPKKSSLQQMHRTLQKDIDAAMGHHVEVTIADEKDKRPKNNKTIQQLKHETAQAEQELMRMRGEVQKMAGDGGAAIDRAVKQAKRVKNGFFSDDHHIEVSEGAFHRIEKAARVSSAAMAEADAAKRRAENAEKRAKDAEEAAEKAARTAQERAEREIGEIHRAADERVSDAHSERDEARADAAAARLEADKAVSDARELVASADDRAYTRVRREADEARQAEREAREMARTAEERATRRANVEIERARARMQELVDSANARADAAERERDEVKRSAPTYFSVPEKFRGYADEGIHDSAVWWVQDVQDVYRRSVYAFYGAKARGQSQDACFSAAAHVLKAHQNILPPAQVKKGFRSLATECVFSYRHQVMGMSREKTPRVYDERPSAAAPASSGGGGGGRGWGCAIDPETTDFRNRPAGRDGGDVIGASLRAALGSNDDIDLADPTISKMTRDEILNKIENAKYL